MADEEIVHIVEDDAAVRHSMQILLEGAGFQTQGYASALAFLQSFDKNSACCIIADIRMPGMSGIELLTELKHGGAAAPVIVVSAHADVALAVHAMKKGAVDFIEKPFSAERLVEAVRAAVSGADRPALMNWPVLSKRENEILCKLLAGKSNRMVAQELEISERTVEAHRASIMRKSGARSLAELVRLAAEDN